MTYARRQRFKNIIYSSNKKDSEEHNCVTAIKTVTHGYNPEIK